MPETTAATIAAATKFGQEICIQRSPTCPRQFQSHLGAFGEFERSMIRERINAGLARAKAQGKTLGRPRNDDAKQRAAVVRLRKQGVGILKIPREVGAGTSYVQRIVAELNH